MAFALNVFYNLFYKFTKLCIIELINVGLSELVNYHAVSYPVKAYLNIVTVGFTDRVADYMAACDVLMSKPGGLSSTEALVSCTALVHTPPIPGCETANAEFFNEHGISFAVDGPEEAAEKAKLLCDDPAARERMKKAQEENRHADCASDIVLLCENLLREMRN